MAGLSWLPGFPPLSRAQQQQQQQQQQQKITNPSSWTDTAARASSNPLPASPSTSETIPRSPPATNTKPRSPASASVPEHSPRPKAVQRMSSFLGLGRSSSASPPPEMGRSGGAGGGYKARQLDWEHVGEEEERREQRAPERLDTWYNPSLMQMVETVQTVMMTKRDMSVGIPAV
jgi:hypothetical protein